MTNETNGNGTLFSTFLWVKFFVNSFHAIQKYIPNILKIKKKYPWLSPQHHLLCREEKDDGDEDDIERNKM